MEEEKSPMTGMTQEEKDEYVMGKAMDIIMGSVTLACTPARLWTTLPRVSWTRPRLS